MLHVKLSDKPCLFCSKKETTVEAKSKEQSFLGVLCPDHLIALLKKWEKKEAAETPSQSK
jgi:hypothetical protein